MALTATQEERIVTDQQELAIQRKDTEWTDAAATPTAEDYRELQAQHDQLQSRIKVLLDVVREARISVEFRHSTTTNFGGTVTTGKLLEKIDAMLAAAHKPEGAA